MTEATFVFDDDDDEPRKFESSELDEIVELARRLAGHGRSGGGGRYVRTPEGARFYGQPIGSRITADVIAAAELRHGKAGPRNALSHTKGRPSEAAPGSRPGNVGSPFKKGPHPVELNPEVKNAQNKASKTAATPRDPNAPQASPDAPNAPVRNQRPPELKPDSSLSGPNKFKVGSRVFEAPEGSRLFRDKSGKIAYVIEPDGRPHMFVEKGEVGLDHDHENQIEAHFNPSFTGDDKYASEQFDNTLSTESKVGDPTQGPEWARRALPGTSVKFGTGDNSEWTKADDGKWYQGKRNLAAGPSIESDSPVFSSTEGKITALPEGADAPDPNSPDAPDPNAPQKPDAPAPKDDINAPDAETAMQEYNNQVGSPNPEADQAHEAELASKEDAQVADAVAKGDFQWAAALADAHKRRRNGDSQWDDKIRNQPDYKPVDVPEKPTPDNADASAQKKEPKPFGDHERPTSLRELDDAPEGKVLAIGKNKYVKTADGGWHSQTTGKVAPNSDGFKNAVENDKAFFLDSVNDNVPEAPTREKDPEGFHQENLRASERNAKKAAAEKDPEKKATYETKARDYATEAKNAEPEAKAAKAKREAEAKKAASSDAPEPRKEFQPEQDMTPEDLDSLEPTSAVTEKDLITGKSIIWKKQDDGTWRTRGSDEVLTSAELADVGATFNSRPDAPETEKKSSKTMQKATADAPEATPEKPAKRKRGWEALGGEPAPESSPTPTPEPKPEHTPPAKDKGPFTPKLTDKDHEGYRNAERNKIKNDDAHGNYATTEDFDAAIEKAQSSLDKVNESFKKDPHGFEINKAIAEARLAELKDAKDRKFGKGMSDEEFNALNAKADKAEADIAAAQKRYDDAEEGSKEKEYLKGRLDHQKEISKDLLYQRDQVTAARATPDAPSPEAVDTPEGTPTKKPRSSKRKSVPAMETGGTGKKNPILEGAGAGLDNPKPLETTPKAGEFETTEGDVPSTGKRPRAKILTKKDKNGKVIERKPNPVLPDDPEGDGNPEGTAMPERSARGHEWSLEPEDTITKDWFDKTTAGSRIFATNDKDETSIWEKGLDGEWRRIVGRDGHFSPRSFGGKGNIGKGHNFNIFNEDGSLDKEFSHYQVEGLGDGEYRPDGVPDRYNPIIIRTQDFDAMKEGAVVVFHRPANALKVNNVSANLVYVKKSDGWHTVTADGMSVDGISSEYLYDPETDTKAFAYKSPDDDYSDVIPESLKDFKDPKMSHNAVYHGRDIQEGEFQEGALVYRLRPDKETNYTTSKVYTYRQVGPDEWIGDEFGTDEPVSTKVLNSRLGGHFFVDDSPGAIQRYRERVAKYGPGAHITDTDISPNYHPENDLPSELDYSRGQRLAKFSHLLNQPDGTVWRVKGDRFHPDVYIRKEPDGWHEMIGPNRASPEVSPLSNYAEAFKDPSRGITFETFGGQRLRDDEGVDFPDGSNFAVADIRSVITALEAHPGTRVSDALKDLRSSPLANSAALGNIQKLANEEYPHLAAKVALANYLRNQIGDSSGASRDTGVRRALGAVNSKGVGKSIAGSNGKAGGMFSKQEIEEAIAALEADKGVQTKSILQRANSPLAGLDTRHTLNQVYPEGIPQGKTTEEQQARKDKFIQYLKEQRDLFDANGGEATHSGGPVGASPEAPRPVPTPLPQRTIVTPQEGLQNSFEGVDLSGQEGPWAKLSSGEELTTEDFEAMFPTLKEYGKGRVPRQIQNNMGGAIAKGASAEFGAWGMGNKELDPPNMDIVNALKARDAELVKPKISAEDAKKSIDGASHPSTITEVLNQRYPGLVVDGLTGNQLLDNSLRDELAKQKIVAKELIDALDRYGFDARTVDTISFTTRTREYSGQRTRPNGGNEAYAWVEPLGRGRSRLTINLSLFSAGTDPSFEQARQSGFALESPDVPAARHIIVHEVGHIMDNATDELHHESMFRALNEKYDLGITDVSLRNAGDRMSQQNKRAVMMIAERLRQKGFNMSKYSGYSNKEFVAEAIAVHLNSPDLSNEVHDFVYNYIIDRMKEA